MYGLMDGCLVCMLTGTTGSEVAGDGCGEMEGRARTGHDDMVRRESLLPSHFLSSPLRAFPHCNCSLSAGLGG